VHDRELGLTATADDGHHPVADGEVLDRGPDGDDLTGELQARDVGGGVWRCGVQTAALGPVGALTSLMGMVATIFVVTALAAGAAIAFVWPPAKVAIRVLGSWTAATGLLLLGWSLR